MSENMTRVYEVGYLLIPTTAEGEVGAVAATISKAITTLKGTILSEGAPEFIDLAYQMEQTIGSKKMKWNQAYFGWTKYELDPGEAAALKKALDAMTDIIRYILVKTTAENTIVFKKPKVEPKRGTAEEEEIVVTEEDLAAVDAEDDLKADHEKLPDLAADLVEEAPASSEA